MSKKRSDSNTRIEQLELPFENNNDEIACNISNNNIIPFEGRVESTTKKRVSKKEIILRKRSIEILINSGKKLNW